MGHPTTAILAAHPGCAVVAPSDSDTTWGGGGEGLGFDTPESPRERVTGEVCAARTDYSIPAL
jgi:Fe-S oxidoreductase